MQADHASPPPEPDHPVWHRLLAAPIGSDPAAFAARLAREQGWSAAFAARAIADYRRFCFLCVTGDAELTPSEAIDQVWHLHLIDTRDYWQRFCPDVLGRDLHHIPGRGTPADRDRFWRQYADALRAFEATFGPPAADLWPAARERFGPQRPHSIPPGRRPAWLPAIPLILGPLALLAAVLVMGVAR